MRGEPCDESSEKDLPWLMPGLDNGLSMVVLTGSGMLHRIKGKVGFVPPGLYDAGGATAGSDGVRVIIHPSDVMPIPLAEGFDVPPGFTASLSVRPRRNKRIGPPHGDCIDYDPFLPASEQPAVYRQIACQQRCLQVSVLAGYLLPPAKHRCGQDFSAGVRSCGVLFSGWRIKGKVKVNVDLYSASS